MIDNSKRYVIENYGRKSNFSNFLPGIAGEMGIPLWCFYVNRGQAITSFGIQDKDHSIMQFYPAHQAYQNTKRLGFRTFVKADGKVVEAFLKETNKHSMAIGMNELELIEENTEGQFDINVLYYTLPTEEVAGLVRKVTIKNTGASARVFELVDGMAAILPFGVNLGSMTEMGQTAKAWMQVLNLETGCPIFKVRASMEDHAQVDEVRGGNYGFAVGADGKSRRAIVSAEALFGYDTSFQQPIELMEKDLEGIFARRQKQENDVPSCFFTDKFELQPGETYTIYELYGQTQNIDTLAELQKKVQSQEYLQAKYEEAVALPLEITKKIHTKTGHELFDLYSKQTYLDNVLRGGEPIVIGKNKVFYLYSRKHGDIERDYNYFKVMPEFFSQGNGNFRDVNQNRRCDVRFSPYVGEASIRFFYNAIQIDGYNPLGIEQITYRLEDAKAEQYPQIKDFLLKVFTPGSLLKKLMEHGLEELFHTILEEAEAIQNTEFHEGYWSDHWTYNLDLVEEYLSIFPDDEEQLLFGDRSYTYTLGKGFVLPARKRYVETAKGLRQYNFIEKNADFIKGSLLKDEKGSTVNHTLLEKMILMSAVKVGALDLYGMGIEMEGGKPGWYDALNGLPGLLGSSMAETYELERMLEFVNETLQKYDNQVQIPVELDTLLSALVESSKKYLKLSEKTALQSSDRIIFWKERTSALEDYREAVKYKLVGEEKTLPSQSIGEAIKVLLDVVKFGTAQAWEAHKKDGSGVCPTYFYYTVTDYKKIEDGIEILDAIQVNTPDFLEGNVRFLKTKVEDAAKKNLYEVIRKSNLYDKKLDMYKVNADLDKASYELGRAKSFTPGWLENESIWLHMEYKYLLEILKADLYEEFAEDFYHAAVPFLKEEVYGRSLLENSSFIASSANPDEKIHGKGFVARLSGSTVEFIHMWQIMMFGKTPFSYRDGVLTLGYKPLIPAYLIGEEAIEATFLGSIPVSYQLPDKNTVTPSNAKVVSYEITTKQGEVLIVAGEVVEGKLAESIRDKEVSKIKVVLERR
ncbi:MAG: hypothetical protein QM644_18645 [Mobilitalea sp.]